MTHSSQDSDDLHTYVTFKTEFRPVLGMEWEALHLVDKIGPNPVKTMRLSVSIYSLGSTLFTGYHSRIF